jgi:hypothetical protein
MNGPVLKISEFGSLNFRHDWRLHFQYPVGYVQRFLPSDNIYVQYSAVGQYVGNLQVWLTDGYGNDLQRFSVSTIKIVDGFAVDTVDWPKTPLTAGAYTLQFRLAQYKRVIAWAPFCIVAELPDSVLFTYTNYRDDFDTVFNTEIDYRVEAVWLPTDTSFLVNAESFRDQNGIAHQLSAQPYETRALTIGGGISAFGVPDWVARKINHIFSCSSVLIDGIQYVRSESAVPEKTDIATDYPLFMYKILVEPQDNAFIRPLPEALLLAAEDGRLILTEDGKAIDMSY